MPAPLAWLPGRLRSALPLPEVAAPDRAAGSRLDAPPTETASIAGATQSAVAARPIIGDGFASFAGAGSPAVPAPSPEANPERRRSGVAIRGRGCPRQSVVSGVEPPLPSRTLSARRGACGQPRPAAGVSAQFASAILYKKGDVAGLTALAAAANDPAERSALEWASLRADPHPSFAALAGFLEAHPGWPSEGWIRERQEADLLTHPDAPTNVAAYFADRPPQSSAGKIAAARAAQAMGRSEEASQIIRALWREGSFDALTESVILRDFGASLTKLDHTYRADRLLYAGYLSAGSRAAALAGADVSALAQARIAAARAPMSPALVKAVPPALRNDPGLLFSRIQYARRAGRVYEAAVLLSLAPRDRAALVNPDRWWSERKMVARTLLDLDEPRLAFEVCDQAVQPDLLRGSGRRRLPRRLDRLAFPQ